MDLFSKKPQMIDRHVRVHWRFVGKLNQACLALHINGLDKWIITLFDISCIA